MTESKMSNSEEPSKTCKGISLSDLVADLEDLLQHNSITDYPTAFNGLQIENQGRVTQIGAAVDGCEATLKMAAERGIDLLLVHHGLFWGGTQMITGPVYRKLKLALDSNIAVFSSHLPLDLHPILGNNALLARALGLESTEPFFISKGIPMGVKGVLPFTREELQTRLSEVVDGPVKLIAGGKDEVGTVGIVTGGAGGDLFKAVAEGVDTFITGEGPHWTYTAAEEQGINLLYAGHYATETFGVKALAAHLSAKYHLPWEFLDYPTGL